MAMIAAKRLPEVLKSVLNDGVDGACLMTVEGSILAAVFSDNSKMTETSLAAISSSIWNNISQGNPDITFHLVVLEKGCLGITTAGKGYLLAVYGKQVAPGLLKGRLDALSGYFTRIFEQLK